LDSEDYENALLILAKLEETCEVVVSHGDEIDSRLILMTLHNSAVCLQKSGNLEECISYLDGCN
jgi:hypothetical protein